VEAFVREAPPGGAKDLPAALFLQLGVGGAHGDDSMSEHSSLA
jgi:hypothetical protein